MELAFIVKGINPKSGEVYRPTNEQWKLQNLKGKLKQSLIGVGNTVIKVKAKKKESLIGVLERFTQASSVEKCFIFVLDN